MTAEKPQSGGDELAAIERWPDALGDLQRGRKHYQHSDELLKQAYPLLVERADTDILNYEYRNPPLDYGPPELWYFPTRMLIHKSCRQLGE